MEGKAEQEALLLSEKGWLLWHLFFAWDEHSRAPERAGLSHG